MNLTAIIALAVVGVVLLTMPVFAVVSRGKPVDPEVAKRPTTALLGYWIRDWVMWVIAPLERAIIATGVSPDVLNVVGAVMGLAAGIAYAEALPALGGWFVLLGGLADIMDGRVARARGLVSSYGEFLDSMLDRFAEVFAFVGVGMYVMALPTGVAATVLAAGASLLVSYARAKGDAVGVACRGGVMQRAERLVLLALTSIIDEPVTRAVGWPAGTLLVIALWLIGLGALGTAIYRTVFIARALKPQAKP
jgi:CDP-diacylglycerol--glycerol-3-phosphate 3-phosphatidyltransferase